MTQPNYPAAFLQSMRDLLGSDSRAFFQALKEPPEPSLRINSLRAGAVQAVDAVPADVVAWEPMGRYRPAGFRPGNDLLHFAGAYYMQDSSAMAPARVLAPQPGEHILDLCAAPGGKSGQIAQLLHGQGVLIANEIDRGRVKILSGNLERLGVINALVTSLSSARAAERWPGAFDGVLVDAPCSGEGMFRRDANARAEWTPAAPAGCAVRQAEILDNAAHLVRPGGRLVYSTCTFNRTENEDTISAFLSRHTDYVPEEFTLPGVGISQGGMLRLWPHKLRGEGHFVARLHRTGAAERPVLISRRPDPASQAALARLLQDVLTLPPAGECIVSGDMLVALPAGAPDLSGCAVFRQGLHLCRIARNYIEPDHALAMAMPAAQRTLALDEASARKYLSGQTLDRDTPDGWTLMTFSGFPLGWGKAVGGTIKNHLPKGLRVG